MDSDQELSECPLCLEALEADDMNFFPCTCCYQICRFCWHRIRTDENGLCPACRKPYSENPAQFKPLTDEEIQQVKRERKIKESNKKPKISESRKHLTNLRVVQRNLVFVNGLPSRLDDAEVLRRNDHFGKYGKIIKLVTSPAHNGQMNSICVYITYSRSDEALRAIQSLCNHQIDGRTLKATLGTTKYCSRYLKGAVCQKTDCLYLHELGDPSASFTKEQMQQGLHLDYERKLMEQYLNQSTPKSNRATSQGQKTDSNGKGAVPLIPPLLTSTTTSLNGQGEFESTDETLTRFESTTGINGDSDSSSTSSSSTSEQDPSFQNSTSNSTEKHFDSIPEYKLFSNTTPSIHTLLFGTTDNPTIDDLEKRMRETDLNCTNPSNLLPPQESDELGFDPCSLFMSALASDIEDERRPPSSLNSYGYSSTSSYVQQHHPHHHQQQQYPPYHEEISTSGQKPLRYPMQFTSPRTQWNGYSQASSQYAPTNLQTTYPPLNSTVNPNFVASTDRWMTIPRTDPSVFPLTSKIDLMSSQWSNPLLTSSSSPSSGPTNFISNPRWSPSTHFPNGKFVSYSNPSTIDDGNR